MFTRLPKLMGDEKCLCGSSKYLKCSRQELFMLEEWRDESVKARMESFAKQFMLFFTRALLTRKKKVKQRVQNEELLN